MGCVFKGVRAGECLAMTAGCLSIRCRLANDLRRLVLKSVGVVVTRNLCVLMPLFFCP